MYIFYHMVQSNFSTKIEVNMVLLLPRESCPNKAPMKACLAKRLLAIAWDWALLRSRRAADWS